MATTGQTDETTTPEPRQYTLDRSGLTPVGRRPSLPSYLKQVWDYRSFILFDSKSRVSTGNSDEHLGNVWMVLNPILNGATYFFVFGILLGTGRGVPNFIAYLIIGVFMFRFTTQSILQGARSVNNNRALIGAFHFPRATLPLAACVRELMAIVPTYVTMFALVLLIPPLEPITWKWLIFIPAMALQFLFNVGLSLLLARIVTQFRDVANLISFGTRLWLYVSCVFFSAERFESIPVMMTLMYANPMFCLLDIVRDAILYDAFAAPERWLVLGAWTLGLLVVGTLVFWQAEEAYGREI